jgi:serine/threonine-protein kinase RsbW/sigma-B regulation protein RsbU (phosphoserine phosphatase)
VALEEVIANVIEYGYPDDEEHKIILRLALHRKTITAEVEDDGVPFNPVRSPEPPVNAPIEDRPLGGLGIHLARSLMDELTYSRSGDRNILHMKKQIPQDNLDEEH